MTLSLAFFTSASDSGWIVVELIGKEKGRRRGRGGWSGEGALS